MHTKLFYFQLYGSLSTLTEKDKNAPSVDFCNITCDEGLSRHFQQKNFIFVRTLKNPGLKSSSG
jgi:hypothetical protein